MAIDRMLRATMVGRQTDAVALLSRVQAAGLLHIEPVHPLSALGELPREEGEDPLARANRLARARGLIFAVPAQAPDPAAEEDLDALVERVEAIQRRREELLARAGVLDACIAALEPFGEVDPAELQALEAAGVAVGFYRLTWNDWHELEVEALPHFVASQSELELHVVLFGPAVAAFPLTPLRLPPLRLGAARAEREAVGAELMELEKALGARQHLLPAIDARLDALADRVAVLRAIAEGEDHGEVFAVRGYIPAEVQSDLQRALGELPAALVFEDPEPGEAVPVRLRQGPVLSGFSAVVRAFSGISYWEKDFTPAVALLFLVFGSLCLLDAGYGLMLALTGLILRRRGMPEFGTVFLLTGAATALLGTLSGQLFGLVVGQNGFLVGQEPVLSLAKDPMSSFIFSLIVGLAAMTLSHATAIWQRGWRTAATGSLLVSLAAVAFVLGAFAAEPLARLLPGLTALHVEQGGKGLAGLLLGGGILGWMIHPDPVFGEKARAANAAWTLYAGLTGLGQDVMSHMRLFGIALSGSIMAMVVNQIAGMFPLVVTVLVAIVGHVFVFLLSLLSLYIHTNRLIFLEFGSKCFDGGQRWYEPLRPRRALLPRP